jgi:hypothetical protein
MFARTSPVSASRFATFTVICTVLLLGATPVPAALLNAGFESPNASGGDVYGSSNWFAFNDAYTTASVPAHSGTQSLKIFGPFFQGGGAGVVQPGFAASEGDLWEARAYLRNDSTDPMQGSNFAVVKLEFLNASNAVIGFAESPQFNAATSTPNLWTLQSAQGTAPAGTTSAQIVLVHVQLNNPVTGGSVFFDDASFGIVPEPSGVALLGLAGIGLLRGRGSRRASSSGAR